MSSRLVYSERGHRYSLDGRRVPSVTGVIGKATGKPALIKWAARLAAQWAADNREGLEHLGTEAWVKMATTASDRARDLAAANGTRLHKMAEALLYGDPLPTTDPETGEPYPDDIVRSAEQAARFLDAWQVEPVIHEAPVFHEFHRWAGRLDLVADLADGHRWLLDWKTGATGVWPETSLQLAAYRHATHVVDAGNDRTMPEVDRGGAVWLRPDGWELVPVDTSDGTYDVFGHAMRVAEWVGMSRDQSVGASLPVPA